MNELEQSLCSAIQIAASGAVKNSGLTKTIEATIVTLEDPAINLYKVAYMGNEMEAYGDSSVVYEEGDKVIVLLQEGDISKVKKILGSSTPSGNQYASIDDADYSRLVSDGYVLNFNDINLCSYTPTEYTIPFTDSSLISLLKEYLSAGMRQFTLMANVQTKLDSRQKETGRGYYGIKLRIPVKIPSANADSGLYTESEVVATMDPRTMLGHVYDFRIATLQSIDFEFPENAIYNDELNPQLEVLVNNFSIEENKPDDIFFTNIQVRNLKEIVLNDSGNALEILATQGDFFITAPGFDSTKTLTPILRINGKPKDVRDYECYWYVKDSRVKNIYDDGYETHGSYGWHCLNDKKEVGTGGEGNSDFQWVTNNYELIVNREDISTELTYKCVLVQKEFVIKSEIGIKNLQAVYEIQLSVADGTSTTIFDKNYGNIDLSAKVRRLDTNQVSVMPTASEQTLGMVLQYTGESTEELISGQYYKCVAIAGDFDAIFEDFCGMPIAESTKNGLLANWGHTLMTGKNLYLMLHQNGHTVRAFIGDCTTPEPIVGRGTFTFNGVHDYWYRRTEAYPVELVNDFQSSSRTYDWGYDYVEKWENLGTYDNFKEYKWQIVEGPHTTIRTSWQRYDSTGAAFYDDEAEGLPAKNLINEDVNINGVFWKETQVSYPCARIKDSNKIECTFIEEDLDTGTSRNIGTKSIIVSTAELYDYNIIIEHDKFNYKYDAEGDSPRVASYDGPISSKVYEIDPISFIIVDSEGKELSENDYGYCVVEWQIPKASMIIPKNYTGESENYYFCRYNGKRNSDFYYDIKNSYDSKLRDNNIELTVNYKGAVLKQSIPFHFSKEGQNGTNGTKFSAVITYDGYAYGEISHDHMGREVHNRFLPIAFRAGKYQGGSVYWGIFKPCIKLNDQDEVYNKIVEWEGNNQFEIKVYKDGELIQYPEEIYSVEWSILDPNETKSFLTIDPSTGVVNHTFWEPPFVYDTQDVSITHPIANSNDSPCNIIKAKVTIKSTATDNSREQSLYAFYPVDTLAGSISGDYSSEMTYNPLGMIGGYDDVMYAPDGTQPNYDNRYPFKGSSEFSFIKDLTPYIDDTPYSKWYVFDEDNFTEVSSSLLECTTRPANKYDNGKTQNVVVQTSEIYHNHDYSYSYWDEDSQETVYVSDVVTDGIETDITEVENEVSDLQSKAEEARLYLNALINFQIELDNGENLSYNNYIEKLRNSYNMLNSRSLLFSYLNELLKTVSTIEELVVNRPITFTPALPNTHNFLNNIKSCLLHFGDSNVEDRKTYANIPNYLCSENYTSLSYSESDFIALYGLSRNNQLKANVSYFNELLVKYFAEILVMKSYPEDLQSFTDLRGLMDQYINNNQPLNILINGISDGEKIYGHEFLEHKDLMNNWFNSLGTENVVDYYQIKKLIDNFKSEHFVYKEQYYYNKYNDLKNRITRKLQLKELELQDMVDFARFRYVYYYKSIHMYLNYYSMSNLNEWDGSKLKIDEDGQYVLAPQMGAGYKDTENKYTGLVMGITNINAKEGSSQRTQKVGLLGLSHGAQSLFISAEDGSAIFGKTGKGQIILDPTSDAAMLYSYGYWQNYDNHTGLPTSYSKANRNYKGTLINLTESYMHLGENVTETTALVDSDERLKSLIDSYFKQANPTVGEFPFELDFKRIYEDGLYSYIAVSSAGYLVALALEDDDYVQSQGVITAEVVNGATTFSYLGPQPERGTVVYNQIAYRWNGTEWETCTIGSSYVTYSNKDRVYPFAVENYWLVNKRVPGISYNISGYGKIFSGRHETLDSTQPGFYLDNTGLSIGSKFKIKISGEGGTEDCVLTLGEGAVAGTGAHWTINSNEDDQSYIAYNCSRFTAGADINQVYLGTDGIRLGTAFKVNKLGHLIARDIDAQGAVLGGWTIGSNEISANGIHLYSNGNITGGSGNTAWSINNSDATFNNIVANVGGQIGGWTINGNTLTSGNIILNGSTGSITGSGFILDSTGLKLQKAGVNKLTFDTSGNLTIKGTIYASNGEIGSWSITNDGIESTGSAGGETIRITPTTVCASRGVFDAVTVGSQQGLGTLTTGTINFVNGYIYSPVVGYDIPLSQFINEAIDAKLVDYYTKTECDSRFAPINHNHDGVYAPAGSYASANHTHTWGGSGNGGDWSFSGYDTSTVNISSVPGTDTVRINYSGSGVVGGTTSTPQ